MASDTALLVIDMQAGIVAGAYQEQEVLERLKALIARARAAGLPVIYLQHDGYPGHRLEPGIPGWQIHAAIAPQPGDLVIRKTASDSFWGTNLQQELEARGINRVLVTGMQTQFCVDTTARRAASLGYDVTLVADGHTTSGNALLTAAQIIQYHNAILAHLTTPGAPIQVQPAEQLLVEH
jgi:nicotinamidase-related amidase